MDRQRLSYLLVNLVGGVAVLGSYAQGILTHPGETDALWGTMPGSLVPVYTAVMPFAALGYLVTMAFLLLTPPEALRLKGEAALPRFTFVTAVFLVASTLWMPLCWEAIDYANTEVFRWIQLTLTVAGACALLNLWMLLRLEAPPRPKLRWAAVAGSVALVLQCTVLDAFVWPRFFTV